jgi:hypothetical protein
MFRATRWKVLNKVWTINYHIYQYRNEAGGNACFGLTDEPAVSLYPTAMRGYNVLQDS